MPWTEADRVNYDVIRERFSSDMSDAEFALICEPHRLRQPLVVEPVDPFERGEHEARLRRARGASADDPPSIGVDDKGDIDEASPCRHIGEIRQPQRIQPLRMELPVDLVLQGAFLSLTVVFTGLPRTTPCTSRRFISGSTVQRATFSPSRCNSRQTLRAP